MNALLTTQFQLMGQDHKKIGGKDEKLSVVSFFTLVNLHAKGVLLSTLVSVSLYLCGDICMTRLKVKVKVKYSKVTFI